MEEKNRKDPRQNSEATQNEQEQSADIFFTTTNESDELRYQYQSKYRYPEKKDIGIPAEPDDSIYAFRWESIENEEKTNQIKDKSPKSSSWMHTFIIAVSFIAAFAVLCTFFIANSKANTPTLPGIDTSAEDQTQNESSDTKTIYVKDFDSSDGALTPQEIYTSCSPSVVSISASGKSLVGIGSGFVITSSGYIATAHHVICDMDDITVIFNNGKEYKAELIASDELTDLALLKIPATDLEAVEFGKSSDLMVGDELLAIGTPASLEFSGSMSRGDVSYTDRTVFVYDDGNGTLKKKMRLIQTTAALNPGNSGGPVFDIYGKVVGIVTMRLGNSFDGIGFVIPSDGAAPILYDMMDGTELTDNRRSPVASHAARLGIQGESYVSGKRVGVKIADFLSDDSDTARKLRVGDVIVSVGGIAVTSASELSETIKKYDPGDKVEITVCRSDQLLTFIIILGY